MRDTGTGRLGATYNVTNYTPLDTRQLVPTFNDLLLAETWTVDGLDYTYNGMFVVVGTDDADKNGIYRLFDANNPGADDAPNYKLASSWHKVAEVSDLDNIKEAAAAITSRVTTLEGKVEALEGASGGVDEDAVNDLIEAQLTTLKVELDAKYAAKTNLNNFYTKTEVDTKIDEAIAGGEVDLSNYYNKAETDSKFATKEEFNDHINEYESKVNQNITSINNILTDHTRDINDINNSINELDDKIDAVETTVYTPSVSADGNLSWSNNGGLVNPDPVNIKGPKGEDGEPGRAGKDIAAITIEIDPNAKDSNGKTHFGELKWTTNPASTTNYSDVSLVIEPEFECTVISTDASTPAVEMDPTSEITTETLANGSTAFKPQYNVVLKDIAPKMFIRDVDYAIGGLADVSVAKRTNTNEYVIDMTMPVPKGVASIPVTYNGDNATTSVNVSKDAAGKPQISVALDSPIIIVGATATMENMTDKTINVTVSQVDNKATFNFTFPNILDDGELA